MTSHVSGISVSAASTQHVIQYLAYTPDDGDTAGVASVTASIDGEGRPVVPWWQLAAIPGFVEGRVIREHDGDPGPLLLGPGTDAPGHDAWCVKHIDDSGNGQSQCWGERTDISAAYVHLIRYTGSATAVYYYAEFQSNGEELTPAEARERAAELRAIAARLEVLAAQAQAGSAVAA